MKDNTYNGWTNWATWNANLWLTNDEVTHNQALECSNYHDLKEYYTDVLEGIDDIPTSEVNFKEIYLNMQGA